MTGLDLDIALELYVSKVIAMTHKITGGGKML